MLAKLFLRLQKAVILCCIFIAFSIIVSAQNKAAKNTESKKQISTDLFGLFFEDINYSADGGLYAELIQNRSFEYSPTDRREWNSFSSWEYITPGYSYGSIGIATNSPLHENNPHYVVMNVEHVGDTGIGIKNSGFDGIVVKAGENYNFSLFVQQITDDPISLWVNIRNSNGKILSEVKFSTTSKNWKHYTATLQAIEDCDSASLVILATSRGRLALDMVSLFPARTFMNHPNGLRSDLAQVLADSRPKFIRFPGGCLVHGDGLGNMYRWKNTIGPVEQRVEQKNIWGYHQTVGLGYFEYFQFCEDIGAKPLPVLPAAVSCQNSGGTWRIGGTGQKALPIDEMDEYIQEVLDLIEWANGSANSVWGAKRAAAGHPAPFNLQYIGIGNEDKITSEFESRFKLIYNAVKQKYPGITVIGTVGPFPDGEDFSRGWKYANQLNLPVVDEHYYKDPEWLMANLHRYDSYQRSNAHVYLGEYASWGNKMKNAISEAAYMTALERNGDVVKMASYAPLLAKKNYTQWKTDMIFFDNKNICLTPNYYVQKMFMTNQGNTYFDNVITKDTRDTSLAASCVQDSITGDLIIKLVNTGRESKSFQINLKRFGKFIPDAEQTVLSGNAEDENKPGQPEKIKPVLSAYKAAKSFEYVASPMSLAVIRIKTK